MDDAVDVYEINDRPDKPTSFDISVFPMRKEENGDFTCADSGHEAEFWDILVRVYWEDDQVDFVEEYNNLTFEEADQKALELADKYNVEPEWVNC